MEEKVKMKYYSKIVIANIPPRINDSYILNNVIKNICHNIEPISFILERKKTENTQSAHIIVEDEATAINLKNGINDKAFIDHDQRLEFNFLASIIDSAHVDNLTLDGVRQHFVDVCLNEFKCLTLIDVIGEISNQKIVIYANTIEMVNTLQQELNLKGFKTLAYHEGIEMSQRELLLHQFRMGDANIIIATDCINNFLEKNFLRVRVCFELPPSLKQYIQRFGRSGCYGRKGFVIILCNKSEMSQLKAIIKNFNTRIDELQNDFTNCF